MLAAAALLTAQLAGQHPSFLVGRWFGQGEPHDKSEMWLATLTADGAIAVEFRTCHKGTAADQYEKGSWWFENGIEHVRITWSGGRQTLRETPYRILSHDGKKQTYSMPNGFVFQSGRVAADFEMPSCETVS